MSYKILILEDNALLVETLEDFLGGHHFTCKSALCGKEALKWCYEEKFDLYLLDVKLPDMSGFDFLKALRTSNDTTPAIFLTSANDKASVQEGFLLGADDYIKKPFDFDILVARIEARLRFGGTNVIKIDDLTIDPDEEKITYKGIEIELKGKPFEVLTHLARHSDQIVSKEQLLDAIWEEPELVTPNVIEVAINQIRQKMDKPLEISTIETVRRRGYRFCFPKKV